MVTALAWLFIAALAVALWAPFIITARRTARMRRQMMLDRQRGALDAWREQQGVTGDEVSRVADDIDREAHDLWVAHRGRRVR